MAHKKTKLKNKIWSLALCASMILSCLPISAFAETDSGLCEHHHEHTAECGYVAAVEGQPCTHEHTDGCYSIVKCIHEHDENCGENGETCTHVCSEESGCITVKHNCHHTHDASCGYAEATESTPCGHVHNEVCGYIEAVEEVLCDCTDTDENGEIVHTEGCGYVEAVEGFPCTHIHDETCGYAEETGATPCTHICSIEGGCYELVCFHAVEGQHDDTCGYVAAVEGSPCKYECEEDHGEEESTETVAPVYTAEEVKAMIDALPSVSELESMDSDELNSVYEQAQETYDAFETLTDKEQIELADELVKLRDVLDFMTTPVTPLATEAETFVNSGHLNFITYSDGVSQFFTYNSRLYKITYTNLDWTAVQFYTYRSGSDYYLRINDSAGNMSVLYDANRMFLKTSDIPTTQGAELICYNTNKTKVATITCLELNGNPTWNWASNGSSASAVFTATSENVCATVGASVTLNTVTSDNTGNHTAEYTATATFGGRTHSSTKTVTSACSYQNGICSVCGYIQPATKNNEGYYEISNAGQLLWFAQQVNSGSTGISGKLTANIDLNGIAYTPIGTESNPYTGTFDGNGKTISNLSITATSSFQGLFGVIDGTNKGGIVKNFTLNGTIDITATVNNIGGVAGYAKNGATIENVTSCVSITDSRTGISTTNSSDRIIHVGGIVASLENSSIRNSAYNGTLTVQIASSVGGVVGVASGSNAEIGYCTNTGNVTSNGNSAHVGGITGDAQTGTYVGYCSNYGKVTSGGEDCLGGIVGYANQNVTIEYCGNIGDVECTCVDGGYIGGVLGYIRNDSFALLTNCFNFGKITSNSGSKNYPGAIIGWCRNSNVSMIANNYYLNSDVSASSGTTINNAYAMTAEQFSSGEVAYLLNGSTNAGAWKQTLKSDSHPNFTGNSVYGGYICGSGNSDFVYQNDNTYLLDEPHPNHDFNNQGTCTYCGATVDITPNGDGVYEITNLGQLQWFANQVNSGNTSINAKLMANIDVSTIPTFGIGTESSPYTGTFNGNGHKITISLRSSAQYLALFPYVNGATIQNLTVDGIIACSAKYAASIVGSAKGDVTIENCISSVTIKSTLDGDGTHGGFVGVAESGGTLTITNCAFIGAIKGTDTTSCGGFVGWANGKVTISNSFVAATFTVSTSGSCTFSRNPGNVTLNNCYYLDALGTAQGTKISATQLANGNLAWLLNSSADNGIWKQNIGKDKTPNFSGEAVYQASPCEIYVNSESEKNQEHTVENGVCKNCGKIISDYAPAIWNNEQNTYEIYNISQLFWFANEVNSGKYSINGKLMADLDLSGYTWTPIAYLAMSDSATVGYSGVFDGNGHVICNITVITPTSAMANGLFGIITTGTVKHLGIDNLYFDNDVYDHRAGGIAGQLMSGGTIENCFVVNSTIKASSRVVGGIVGMCKGTVKNCYTANLSLAGHSNRFGGITGDYAGGSIINCYTNYAALGSTASSVGTTDSLSAAGISTEVFTSGKIAYLLNGSTSDGSLVWYQTCGTGYPAFSGKTVYANASCNGNTYANTKQAGNTEHSYVNGFCQYCDAYQPAVKNASGYYEISNAGQLYWFAALTNGELDGIAQDASANAILLQDIIVNTGVIVNGSLASDTKGFRNWTPIGNYNGNGSANYAGTFDGNGHTVSGIYMTASITAVGFVGRTTGTIKDLTIINSYFNTSATQVGCMLGANVSGIIEKCISVNCIVNGKDYVGGIVGANQSELRNCISQNCTVGGAAACVGGIVGFQQGAIANCASVDCIISGTEKVGGIAGVLSAATVSNCYSNSQLKVSSQIGCGIGHTQGTCTISNCYFTGSITGTSTYIAAITYINGNNNAKVTVNDCYYISSISVGAEKMQANRGSLTATNVAAKTADEFKTGEVAYLLNGSSSTGVWKQTIGSDAAPNFSGMTVYYDSTKNPQYYNNTTSDKVASVTITWTDMSFSYNKGTWDTDTMTWEGGGWEADAGCGTVNVKNTGNVGVTATFGVNLTNTSYGVSVGFTENGIALTDNKLWIAAGNSKFVTVNLTGKEPSDYMAETTIGQITITLSTE